MGAVGLAAVCALGQDLQGPMKSADDGLSALERRIGYRFKDHGIARTALTHSSAAAAGRESYQRLEFLGDRVLGLVVAEMLVESFPGAPEGELSRRLGDLVRKESCAGIAMAIDLRAAIRVGGPRAQKTGIVTTKVLGDACEALIAAIYQDGGFEAARAFIETHWRPMMVERVDERRNAKAALQEWSQGVGLGVPEYVIAAKTGPDHEPEFDVEVRVKSLKPAQGSGRSRREAEQSAAAALLAREGVWTWEA